MWKPGQLVTIEGKVYRIRHNPKSIFVCDKCALRKRLLEGCISLCSKIKAEYMYHSYFEQIYPKT